MWSGQWGLGRVFLGCLLTTGLGGEESNEGGVAADLEGPSPLFCSASLPAPGTRPQADAGLSLELLTSRLVSFFYGGESCQILSSTPGLHLPDASSTPKL
jgi:hypothetical protein